MLPKFVRRRVREELRERRETISHHEVSALSFKVCVSVNDSEAIEALRSKAHVTVHSLGVLEDSSELRRRILFTHSLGVGTMPSMKTMQTTFAKVGTGTSSSQPTLPQEPKSKLVESGAAALKADTKLLQDRVVEVLMMGGATRVQEGSGVTPQGVDPLSPHPVILYVDRVTTGPRGGLEGRLVLSPRHQRPDLKEAFDDAGVDWQYCGTKKIFIPDAELSGGYSLPESKLVENKDALGWFKAAEKVQRARAKAAQGTGGNGVLDRLSGLKFPGRPAVPKFSIGAPLPKFVGLAGAATAAALLSYYAYDRFTFRSSWSGGSPSSPRDDTPPAQVSTSKKEQSETEDSISKTTASSTSTQAGGAKDKGALSSANNGTSLFEGTPRETKGADSVAKVTGSSIPAQVGGAKDKVSGFLSNPRTSPFEGSSQETKATLVDAAREEAVKQNVSNPTLASKTEPAKIDTGNSAATTTGANTAGITPPVSAPVNQLATDQVSKATVSFVSISNQAGAGQSVSNQGGQTAGAVTSPNSWVSVTGYQVSGQYHAFTTSTGIVVARPIHHSSYPAPVFIMPTRVEQEVQVLPPPGFQYFGNRPEVKLRLYNMSMSDGKFEAYREVVVSRLPTYKTADQYIAGIQQLMNAGKLPGTTYAYKRSENGSDVIAFNLDPRYKAGEVMNWIATQSGVY